jgi:hypothetical protein
VKLTRNGSLKAVGSGIATITATVRYHGTSASTTFTVYVAALQITSDNSTVFQNGQAGSFTVTTDSSPTAQLKERGALPDGLTFTDNGDGTATIAGTPSARVGAYPITVTAKNGVSPKQQQNLIVYVGTPPSITSGTATQFTVGSAGSFTVRTSGYPAASLSESGNLPNGVSFTDNGDGTATVSGTAASGSRGSYPITITASNGLTPATQSFTITVLDQSPTSTAAVLAGTTRTIVHYGPYTFTVPAAGIAVHLLPVGSGTDAVAPATSASNGSYEFDGVPPGSYQVEFVDPSGHYQTQWYSGTDAGATDRSGAATVTLTADQATVGINAKLVAAAG